MTAFQAEGVERMPRLRLEFVQKMRAGNAAPCIAESDITLFIVHESP